NNVLNSSSTTTVPHPEQTSVNKPQIPNSNLIDSTTAVLSNLNLFDSNNSFLVQSFHPMLKKLEAERGQQLPDLINGIDGYQNHLNNGLNGSASSSSLNGGLGHLNGINNLNNLVNLQNQLNYNQPEDWEQVLKLAMLRNNKQMEERNNLLNMMGNGLGNSFSYS
uniref:Uncharacterized protein n=1 Tax=Megaselia scalaris TaxID=36166 RepID=T1GGA2_MEGSC